MCRFAIYQGPPLPLSHLLITPSHSLRHQSVACRERTTPRNEDGYGIGWYNGQGMPHWVRGDMPAAEDPAFEPVARSIRSGCFFGHVRAATKTMRVSVENSHPFSRGPLLWMHNGLVEGFEAIEPLLRERIRGSRYRMRGTTDSEASFALFLAFLENPNQTTVDSISRAMAATIRQLEQWRRECGIEKTHYLNLAVTDGRNVVATRYYQSQVQQLTLYYWQGQASEVAAWSRSEDYEEGPAAIVASEPLDDSRKGWRPIPVNHMLALGPGHLQTIPLT